MNKIRFLIFTALISASILLIGGVAQAQYGNPTLYYCPKNNPTACVTTNAYTDYLNCTAQLGAAELLKIGTICYSDFDKASCANNCGGGTIQPSFTVTTGNVNDRISLDTMSPECVTNNYYWMHFNGDFNNEMVTVNGSKVCAYVEYYTDTNSTVQKAQTNYSCSHIVATRPGGPAGYPVLFQAKAGVTYTWRYCATDENANITKCGDWKTYKWCGSCADSNDKNGFATCSSMTPPTSTPASDSMVETVSAEIKPWDQCSQAFRDRWMAKGQVTNYAGVTVNYNGTNCLVLKGRLNNWNDSFPVRTGFEIYNQLLGKGASNGCMDFFEQGIDQNGIASKISANGEFVIEVPVAWYELSYKSGLADSNSIINSCYKLWSNPFCARANALSEIKINTGAWMKAPASQDKCFSWPFLSSVPTQQCGNGVKEGTEACDDGTDNGTCPKMCSIGCLINSCDSSTGAQDTVEIIVDPIEESEQIASDTVEITVDPNNASITDLVVSDNYCALNPSLSFNWKFNGNSVGDIQKSYQLVVSEDPSLSNPIPVTSNNVLIGALIKYNTQYYWKIIVTDQNGETFESDVQPYKTKASHPYADFSFSYTYKEGIKVYKFTDLSKPTQDIISRNWNFGDNSTSKALEPEHKYAVNGKYSVTLTVADTNGNTCSKTKSLDYQRTIRYEEVIPW